MISKIGEEILGMEKVAQHVGWLSGQASGWVVDAYPEELGHQYLHVHVIAPDGKNMYIFLSCKHIIKIRHHREM